MRTTERLGVSVVGAGYWGPNLVRNFFGSPNWQVISVVERDESRVGRLRRQFPGIAGQRDIDEALSDPRVSAIAVATPVATHFELAKKALLAGKHVIIEKPMTQTAEQSEELCRLADDCRLTLMVDHTFLYTGSVELLRRLVVEQEFGQILYLDSVRVNLGLFQNDVNVVYDLAPHDVSIFNYVLGEYPVSVSANVAHCIHDDTADVAFLTLRYPSGVLAHAHLSWLSPVKVRRLTIAGRNKMALWDDVEPSEKIRLYDKGVETKPDYESNMRRMVSYRTGDMRAPALDTTEALTKAVEEFYRAIVHGEPVRSAPEDGLAVVRVLEAVDHSIAAEGAVIHLSHGVFA